MAKLTLNFTGPQTGLGAPDAKEKGVKYLDPVLFQ
jgi:hypothetical protein